LSACASDNAARLDTAAKEQGKRQAGVNLPPWPAYCREPMPGITPKLGEPVWGSQKRWEIIRSNENRRIDWCAGHYGEIAAAQKPPD
jgi:hypothetical protein